MIKNKKFMFLIFFLFTLFISLSVSNVYASPMNDSFNLGAFRFNYFKEIRGNNSDLVIDVNSVTETIIIDNRNTYMFDIDSSYPIIPYNSSNSDYINTYNNLDLKLVLYYNHGDASHVYNDNVFILSLLEENEDSSITTTSIPWEYLNEPIKIIPFKNFHSLLLGATDETKFDFLNFSIALLFLDDSVPTTYQRMLPIWGNINHPSLMIANLINPAIQEQGEVWHPMSSGNYIIKSDRRNLKFHFMDWPEYDDYPSVFTSIDSNSIEDYFYFDSLNSLYNFYDYQMLVLNNDFYFNNGSRIFNINKNVFNFVDFDNNNNVHSFDSFQYFVSDIPLFAYDVDSDYIFNRGYDKGYYDGYSDAINSSSNNVTGFKSLLIATFAGIGQFLSIELLPGISIGMIILVPIVFGLLFFILGRKD